MFISVASSKGGVAKTTTAIHVAGVLADTGRTVLIDEENAGAMAWARHGRLPFETITARDATADTLSTFEHVVVDTGARITPELLDSLLWRSDYLIVPTTPDALALDALANTLGALESAPASRFGVLLTITPPWPSRAAERARAALQGVGAPVFRVSIPRAVAYQKAALQGVLAYEVADSRAMVAWRAYEELVEEVQENER